MEIKELARRGKLVIGIGGGYQILGQRLEDPYDTEAGLGAQEGLGLLPCVTVYEKAKTTFQVEGEIMAGQGWWSRLRGRMVKGYEIHMGQTRLVVHAQPLLEITWRSGRPVQVFDGASSGSGLVFGTHLHGFFDNPDVLLAVVNHLRRRKKLPPLGPGDLSRCRREESYDRLAAAVRQAVNIRRIKEIMGL